MEYSSASPSKRKKGKESRRSDYDSKNSGTGTIDPKID